MAADPWAAFRPASTSAAPPAAADPWAAYRPAEPAAPARQPWSGQSYLDAARNAGMGVAKAAANSAIGVGDFVDWVGSKMGGTREAEAFEDARAAVQPSNPQESAAFGLEQAAEFFLLPGPGKVKGAARVLELGKAGLANTALAKTQGATDAGAVTAGVLGAVPVVEGVAAAGKWVGSKSAPLVRAAIKPTVTAMRRVAGAAAEGLDAKAGQLVQFIIENRVVSAEKARAIFAAADQELQRVLSLKNAPTDAAERALRYLGALERSAAKQALPAADVATIRAAASEMLEGRMGKTVPVFGPAEGVVMPVPKGAPKPASKAPGWEVAAPEIGPDGKAMVPQAAIESELRQLRAGVGEAVEAPAQFYDDMGRLRDDLMPEEMDELADFLGSQRQTGKDVKLDVLQWIAPRQMASSELLEGLTFKGRMPTQGEIVDAIASKSGKLYERIVDVARENLQRQAPDALEAAAFLVAPAAEEAAAAKVVAGAPKLIRVPREDVSAAEAMEMARANSRWSTRKSWGEQKGAEKEASKAIERAQRDATKAASPEAKALLKREAGALQSAEVLDRMEFRAGNRDVVSLPAWAVAGAEVAQGKMPFLAMAANWLRNNQLKAGIYADDLAKALQRADTGRVVSILHRLGVGAGTQLTSSASVRR